MTDFELRDRFRALPYEERNAILLTFGAFAFGTLVPQASRDSLRIQMQRGALAEMVAEAEQRAGVTA